MSANLEFKIRATGGEAAAAEVLKPAHALNLVKGNFGAAGSVIKREMAEVGQSLSAGAGRAGIFTASLGPAGLALGATAGAAVAAGVAIFSLAKTAADAGAKFHDLSLKTDVSVETFSGLELQLKQSGTDMDALANASVFLQKNLAAAASGNKELQRTFAALGVKDVRAALADTDGTLKTVVRSLGQMESAGERNAAGSKVMGRGFKELSVFIADTQGDLEGVIEESRKAGRVMSGEAAEAADRFGDQLDAMSNAAAIAGRTVGMEAIPQITGAMRDLTGATEASMGVLRSWGRELANIIEFSRVMVGTIKDIGFWDTGREMAGKLEENYRRITREREMAGGKFFDLNAPRTAEQVAAGARERARALAAAGVRPAGGEAADIFAPGAPARKARENELDKLKAFAKEWDFTITSLTGGKHNVGSLHGQGRAMDVSVRGKSDAEVRAFMEAARQAGYGVRDERTRPEGQKVWSGPHIHLEKQNKAVQAATREANKEFEEQESILDALAKKIAEADLQTRAFSLSAIEQEIAAARMSVGLQKLTGPAAELAEVMLADYEATLRARDAAREHSEAVDGLKTLLGSLTEEVFGAVPAVDQMTEALVKAGVPLNSYAGQWARLVALMKDVEPTMVAVGNALPVIPGNLDITQGTGPAVSKEDLAAMGPPPNFAPHLEAITAFKEAAGGAFEGITQGFGSMLQAFLDGGEISGRAFLKMAKSVVAGIAAQAAVKAIFELAEGFAALANPFTAWQAPLHFTAAKIYGLVAAAAAVGALAIPGGKGSGSTAGGYASGGQGSEASPRNAQFNYGGGFATSASEEQGGGSRGRGVMGGALAPVLNRIDQTLSRLQSMPAGQVVTMGAPGAQEAIGVAVLGHSSSNDGFNDSLARNMRVA